MIALAYEKSIHLRFPVTVNHLKSLTLFRGKFERIYLIHVRGTENLKMKMTEFMNLTAVADPTTGKGKAKKYEIYESVFFIQSFFVSFLYRGSSPLDPLLSNYCTIKYG